MNLCGKLLCVLTLASVCIIFYFGIEEGNAFHIDTKCGNRPDRGVPSARRKRFLGSAGAPGEWPWIVSLQMRSSESDPFVQRCEGAIIRNDWILTATTCFYELENRNLSNWIVKTGTDDLTVDGNFTQTSTIEDFLLHADYHPATKYQDIALVKLATPLVFNDYVDRICIPDTTVVEEYKYGECYIAGYDGPTGADPGMLKESHVTLFSNSLCNMMTWRKFEVAANMFCAGNAKGGVDGCESNIGGPISCYIPHIKRYYVKGLRIRADKCGVIRRPNIYLRVSQHYYWIEAQIDNYFRGI
ncbi:transmembrane protease serine 12-like [Engraulis encrasicolus]|uniref:transmembrane protease serine 12-like n=1 Tax=Engraulis encrasicolus TaxID=184585 RepID=UPI002FD040F1